MSLLLGPVSAESGLRGTKDAVAAMRSEARKRGVGRWGGNVFLLPTHRQTD